MRDIAINRIMTTNPITIGPDDTVARAKAILDAEDIHHLPVTVDGVLVGIVTSSDLLKLDVFKGKPAALDAIKVHQVMESEPITLDVFSDLIDVAVKLSDGSFHALPVVEADNVLVGIVTSTDLVNHVLMQVPRGDGTLREEPAQEAGRRLTDARMTSVLHRARETVDAGRDDEMAAAVVQLSAQNRTLKEAVRAAEHFLRSGQAEREHSVLQKALDEVQREGAL
jgi:acetoin utilization protein AcuB